MTIDRIINMTEALQDLDDPKQVRLQVQQVLDYLREWEFERCSDLLQKQREADDEL